MVKPAAMKVETEAEGASRLELIFYRMRALELGLPLHVKVGGVEARADLEFLEVLGVDGAIAPMVESPFAVEKFAEACEGRFSWTALTLESRTAVENRDEILAAAKDNGISGVTIGRGDLAASLGLRGQEDSELVLKEVKKLAIQIQQNEIPLTIGGNMQVDSISALLQADFVFDAIETRRFRIFPEERNGESSSPWLAPLVSALELEAKLLEQLSQELRMSSQKVEERIQLLRVRAGSTPGARWPVHGTSEQD